MIELLERGADLHARDSDGKTALHNAVSGFHVSDITVAELLRRGANVHATDNEGNTPLHRRMRYSTGQISVAIARELLRAGGDLCVTNHAGQTPLDVLEENPDQPAGDALRGLLTAASADRACGRSRDAVRDNGTAR